VLPGRVRVFLLPFSSVHINQVLALDQTPENLVDFVTSKLNLTPTTDSCSALRPGSRQSREPQDPRHRTPSIIGVRVIDRIPPLYKGFIKSWDCSRHAFVRTFIFGPFRICLRISIRQKGRVEDHPAAFNLKNFEMAAWATSGKQNPQRAR